MHPCEINGRYRVRSERFYSDARVLIALLQIMKKGGKKEGNGYILIRYANYYYNRAAVRGWAQIFGAGEWKLARQFFPFSPQSRRSCAQPIFANDRPVFSAPGGFPWLHVAAVMSRSGSLRMPQYGVVFPDSPSLNIFPPVSFD